ncbi:hypothetical protein J3R83DRAFT_9607 [Lanmaoa asiatica]|nr:hypothetical protein J3R83DRAFT_9607 [Lanmaoa asiatica]
MVRWGDPAVKARLAIVDVDVTFLLLGTYGWEYFQSLDVEYAVVRRRLGFRWPLVLGNTTLGCSSANLMIRTWLIWKNHRLVHIILLIVTLGHWTILALGVANIKAFKSNGVCVVYLAQPTLSAGVFAYTMCYDFLVFVLSIVKLSKEPSKSSLGEHLRSQGILYFVVAVTANIPPTVFAFLGSTSMVATTGSFAMTASTIVSCRAVRSLLDLSTPHPSHTSDESVEPDVALTTEISMTQLTSTAPMNV